MKQILIPRYGNPDVMQVVEAPLSEPGPHQVRIHVKAAGVNFADILARKGLYPDAPRPPCVVGYEVAGIVDKTGEGAAGDWVGQRVIALTRFQGYSEYVVVHEKQVAPLPESLDFPQGAAIPVNYLTAYQLVVVMGGLKAGETILIHNAGGGVGLAALDIARHIGARVIGTASSRKHDFLLSRGMTAVIDYRQEDWLPRVLQFTDGKGVELVIDPIGGAHFRKSYRALRATGRLGVFGVSSATRFRLPGKLRFLPLLFQSPIFHPLLLMNSNKGVFGVNLGHLWDEAEKVQQWLRHILEGVEQGWVRPHVDKVFPFQQVSEAHRYIENRQNIGKVVLTPD